MDRIAGWIVGGRFEAGTMLPREEEIGGELNVSRTVVREAMRTLTAKGMVEVRRRLGTRVRPVDTWSLFDPQVVSWRMTSGLGSYHAADLDFHETIIRGADNLFLRQLIPLMTNTLRASFSLSVISMDTARGSLPMHRAVADAVIAGDADGARRALSMLIEAAREDILGALPDYLREEEDAQRGRMADPRA